MISAAGWKRVRRITFYMLLIFAGFVIVWLVLIAKVRAGADTGPPLITDVEIHSLQARWGGDLLTIPMIAVFIAFVRRNKHEIGDVVIAAVMDVVLALGMMFFPAAVIGGNIQGPLPSSYFDTNGSIDYALTYAIGVTVILLILNRITGADLGRQDSRALRLKHDRMTALRPERRSLLRPRYTFTKCSLALRDTGACERTINAAVQSATISSRPPPTRTRASC